MADADTEAKTGAPARAGSLARLWKVVKSLGLLLIILAVGVMIERKWPTLSRRIHGGVVAVVAPAGLLGQADRIAGLEARQLTLSTSLASLEAKLPAAPKVVEPAPPVKEVVTPSAEEPTIPDGAFGPPAKKKK